MRKILFLFLILNTLGCKDKSQNYENSSTYANFEQIQDGYADGTYCAEVGYFYSKTGTRSRYTLEVEIENNELIIIHWPNGGWLDDSYFYPPDITDGYAEVESERGVQYTIEIIGEEGDCYLSNNAINESTFVENEEEKICSLCGELKLAYDDYCDRCTDEMENTCSNCGSYEYGVYGELCSSCHEELNGDDDW